MSEALSIDLSDADVQFRTRQAEARHARGAEGDVALAGVLEEDDAGPGGELRDVPAIADALGAAAAGLQGPAGIRSDNAQLLFELAVSATTVSSAAAPACKTGPQESD